MTPLLTAEEQKAARDASDYPMAPEGIYVCRVSGLARWSAGVGEDPQNGKSLRWIFKVAKGQPSWEGKEFWTWTSLKADSIGRTKRYLTTLGFDLSAEPDDIVGTPCKVQITVEARTDTGEPSNKVKAIFAYEGPELPSEHGTSDIDDAFGADPDDDLV